MKDDLIDITGFELGMPTREEMLNQGEFGTDHCAMYSPNYSEFL